MNLFGGKPKIPNIDPRPIPVNQRQSIRARDQVLNRLAKLRRATVTSELSNPSIKRKVLGAGV